MSTHQKTIQLTVQVHLRQQTEDNHQPPIVKTVPPASPLSRERYIFM